MKNVKRRYVYSALAVPFVAFGVYAATLSPIARQTFFAEFKVNTASLFGGQSETEPEGLRSTGESTDGAPTAGGGESGTAGQDASAGAGRRGRGPGGGFDPAAMFERRDADGDGKLTGDEIGERMRENLDQLDTDQDGSVSLAEFQEGMQRMFANRGAGGAGEAGDDEAGDDSQQANPDQPQQPETE